MQYEDRITKVIEFIGEHLDEELNLDQLSSIACYYQALKLINYFFF